MGLVDFIANTNSACQVGSIVPSILNGKLIDTYVPELQVPKDQVHGRTTRMSRLSEV